MHKVYRHVVQRENACEWVNAAWKLERVGRSGLKMSRSGLKMSRSGWDWMKVGGSGWEWVGVDRSTV